MIATFKNKRCLIYNDNMQLIRQFSVPYEIVNVQISGQGNAANISITTKNGKVFLYKATGQLIRR